MVVELCEQEGWQPMVGPLEVWIDILGTRPKKTKFTSPNGDVDNFVKGLLDCCNGSMWKDDSQIVELHATKAWHEPGDEGFALIQVGIKENSCPK